MKPHLFTLIALAGLAGAPAADAGGTRDAKFVQADIDTHAVREKAWQLAREFTEAAERGRFITVDPRAPDEYTALEAVIEAQELRLDIFAETVQEQARQGAIEQEIAAEILAEVDNLLAELEAFSSNMNGLAQVGFELTDPLELFEDFTDPLRALKLFGRAVQELAKVLEQSPEEAMLDQEERQGMDWNHDGCKGSTEDGCKPFDKDDEQVKRFPRSTTNVRKKSGIIMVDIPADPWDLATVAEAFDPTAQLDAFRSAARFEGGLESLSLLRDMSSDLQILNEFVGSIQ